MTVEENNIPCFSMTRRMLGKGWTKVIALIEQGLLRRPKISTE